MTTNRPGHGRPSREATESQRALELRRFFAPEASGGSHFNETLNNDGALLVIAVPGEQKTSLIFTSHSDAYAETVVWRLKGVHAMVSLIDRAKTQYFLAGAIKHHRADDDEEVITTGEWFGCSEVPTPGGLCENTVALENTDEKYPCFIVNDLSKDDRFAHLPIVDGSLASYRFYAGAPITTSRGINIGSFFLFDDRVRDGLPLEQRKFLYSQASNVMRHLETKREAAERHRVALMSKGIANFLERSSRQAESIDAPSIYDNNSRDSTQHAVSGPGLQQSPRMSLKRRPVAAQDSVLDKIRQTLDHAAEILRESLELVEGGVVFLDTAMSYLDADVTDAYLDRSTDIGAQVHETSCEDKGQPNSMENKISLKIPCHPGNLSRHFSSESTRSSDDKHKASKVLAMSAAKIATWDTSSSVLDAKTLQSLIRSYPKGNVWYIDEEGYFSSLDQINESYQASATSPSGRRRSIALNDLTNRKAEATMLSRIFHKARQIIFLPLWDAGADRWYSGCFVWSQSSVPVFTVDAEIAYLSAFTSSVMVEISRLDAIVSNKMKSDFISSISHEFRSPLHGILASAEFLRDSELNASQIEFISTIQNCSGTLLDTINHVLDYSKINSFENSKNNQGTLSNELYRVTNIALLLEDTINGMMAANEFRGASDTPLPVSGNLLLQGPQPRAQSHHKSVEIIFEIENRNWDYKIQAGALRRVAMNIFGNAQKYTKRGYIVVRLSIQDASNGKTPHKENISLQIRDSGKGMSSEYMERKLYHPFAQEDSFAPGVGLGLSIVWSIVNQLGGRISIRSELGKGTDVEITIPVEKNLDVGESPGNPTDATECIAAVRRRVAGKSVSISRNGLSNTHYKSIVWDHIKKYCTEWFGLHIKDLPTDIVITDINDQSHYQDGQRVLIVHEDIAFAGKNESRNNHRCAIGNTSQPLGPFKLARSLLSLMDLDPSTIRDEEIKSARSVSDAGTQTPSGTPQEKLAVDGINMTDYGFTSQSKHTDTQVYQTSPRVAHDNYPSAESTVSGLEKIAALKLSESTAGGLYTSQRKLAPVLKDLKLPPIKAFKKEETSPSSLNILAVDDNALNLQLLTRYLSKRKSDTIVQATNGVEAVDAVRNLEPGKKFDCIFMDISMPLMDGFEATRLIRSHERSLLGRPNLKDIKPTLSNEDQVDVGDGAAKDEVQADFSRDTQGVGSYIVAVTGLASRRDRDEADDSGFDDYLTKPTPFVKIGQLLERLSEQKAGISLEQRT